MTLLLATGICILLYGVYYNTKSASHKASITVAFKDKNAFITHLQSTGFSIVQQTDNRYILEANKKGVIANIFFSIMPASTARIAVYLYENSAQIEGSEIMIHTLRKTINNKVQQEKTITLPY